MTLSNVLSLIGITTVEVSARRFLVKPFRSPFYLRRHAWLSTYAARSEQLCSIMPTTALRFDKRVSKSSLIQSV
jgi:hypothetical protein